MILSDFLSRQNINDGDTNEIIPISFNMRMVLQHKYYNLDEEREKFMVQTRLQRKPVEYNCQRCMILGRDWIHIKYQKNNLSQ